MGYLVGDTVGASPEPALRLLRTALNNCRRLVTIVNDILDMENIEAGKMPYEREPVDMRALAMQVIEANQAFADSYGVVFGKFVQIAAADRRQRGGTGLGLTITKQIVDQLDGQIVFEPTARGGTIFTVAFKAWAEALPCDNAANQRHERDFIPTGSWFKRSNRHRPSACFRS